MAHALWRVFRLLLPYRRKFIEFILASFVYMLMNLVFISVVKVATTLITQREFNPQTDILPKALRPYLTGTVERVFGILTTLPIDYILYGTLGVAMAALGVQCICQFYQRFNQYWMAERVLVDAQNKLACHLLGMDFSYFQRERAGELISRLTNDLNQFRIAARLAGTMISRPINVIGLLIWMFCIDWQLSIAGLVGVPVAAVCFRFLSKKMRRTSRTTQGKLADVTNAMVQFLNGIRTVKAFNCETFEAKQFAKQNEEYFDNCARRERAVSWERPVISFTTKIGTLAALVLGGYRALHGSLDEGEMLSMLAALALIYQPAKELSKANSEMQVALPGAERVFEIMDMEAKVLDGQTELTGFHEAVTFEEVTFEYEPDVPVLDGINLTLKKGECVALVGPSGGGKSTLSDLLLRFFDPKRGSIRVDGHDLRSLKLEGLRRQIAYVGQNAFLFNCTIRDNIAYGRMDAAREDIEAAAIAANIHHDILDLPHGYNTEVGERGESLSGGQRQRVTIARALFKDAPILILDEATSALDSENERKVQAALDKLMKDRTSLVIAHRLSTVRHADRIVVLDHGRIVGEGTHEALLVSCPIYKNLVQAQSIE